MLNVPRRELDVERLAGRRLLELPEELGQREQFRPRHAWPDVDAVDAEVRQLTQNLDLRLAVLSEGDAVEVRQTVDDVHAERRRGADVPLHAVVELGELLFDRRMPGRVQPGQPAKADEALEQGHRIDAVRRRLPRVFLSRAGRRAAGLLVVSRHLLVAGVSIVLACRATRTSAGFQKR